MNSFARPPHRAALLLFPVAVAAFSVWGCSPEMAGPGTGASGGAAARATGGAGTPGTGGGSGGASISSGGAPGSGGLGTGGMSPVGSGGAPGTGGLGSGGTASAGRGGVATGGSGLGGAASGTGGTRAGSGGSGGSGNCNLPATVSYKRDVQGFLIRSCGGGNGCHLIDAVSTVAAGGFSHGYDWITAGSHISSCPTWPKRFEVVIDVMNQANPPTCSKSRKMPPPDATGAGVRTPLTACEIATLEAWLNEPLVIQTHRVDDSSPTTPYAMPPFN
jgi:hypothetical protein